MAPEQEYLDQHILSYFKMRMARIELYIGDASKSKNISNELMKAEYPLNKPIQTLRKTYRGKSTLKIVWSI